jgi:maltooligosyltrehalose synthase
MGACMCGWDGKPVKDHIHRAQTEAARAHERLETHVEAIAELVRSLEVLRTWLGDQGLGEVPAGREFTPDE